MSNMEVTRRAQLQLDGVEEWQEGRNKMSEAENEGDYPSSSDWQNSDDAGFEYVRSLSVVTRDLIAEVQELRVGIKRIVDSWNGGDLARGSRASAIASRAVNEARTLLPDD